MAKTTAYCFNCDTEFKVSFKGNDPVKFCPLCGEDLELDNEDIDLTEDED